jgi:predicted ATPase
MLDEMPGGAFVASLAPVTDPGALLGTLASALGLREGERAPAEQITESVRGRPTLLVLDNFEQLLPAASLVSELVVRAPELHVVVTSQAALRVAGEVVMGLDALELDAAVELFKQLACGAASRPVLGVQDRDPIREICRRVGCLPLAVELAAPRVSVLAPNELLSRLEQSSDVLRGVARDAPERQRSLRATFEWSYGLLQDSERQLFRRLGVFAGPVAIEAIESVCAASESNDPLSVLDALGGLVEFSLVRREEGEAHGTRFTMPQALRDFARSELEVSLEAQAIGRRHAETVLAFAKESQIWFTADSAATARVLALDAEIRPALAWAARHDPELHRRLLAVLALGLIRRGHVREALDHTTHACASFEVPSDDIDAWLANCKAYALLMSGRLEEGEAAIEPVIAFYRARGDASGLGLALHTAGWLADDRGDRERALALGRESLELLTRSGDPALAGRGLTFLTQVLTYTDPAEAERLLEQAAVSITDPGSDLASAVTTLRGDLALARGAVSIALEHFAESLKLAVRRRDVIQIINDAHCIRFALACGGQHEAALEAEGVAMAMAAEGGHNAHYPFDQAPMQRAREACGPAAVQIVARGGEILPGARVPRLLELANASPRQPSM